MSNKEPIRKKFAKYAQKSWVGSWMVMGAVIGMPTVSGLAVYGGLRHFEASEWDSQVIGDREQTLDVMQEQFNALQENKKSLDNMKSSRKNLYGQGLDVLNKATQRMQEQQAKLYQDTTIYAKDLITSKAIHEGDYYELGQDFINAGFNGYSSIDINADYFQSANRLECHLNLNKKDKSWSNAEYINECMKREGKGGVVSMLSGSTVSFIFFIMLLGIDSKLAEWEKLPNNSKSKLLPSRRKWKEN